MGKSKAMGLLALLVSVQAALGQERPRPHGRGGLVRLSFSVEAYDPSRPSGAVMRCVVQNDTPTGLHVPVGYDGGYVRLQSGLLSLRKVKKEKQDVRLTWVEPGHQQVVFELPLGDVLGVAAAGEPVWVWDWPRRPEPPRSPIHKYRQPGFLDEASFTVSLDMGGYTLKSEAATLKVRSGEGG